MLLVILPLNTFFLGNFANHISIFFFCITFEGCLWKGYFPATLTFQALNATANMRALIPKGIDFYLFRITSFLKYWLALQRRQGIYAVSQANVSQAKASEIEEYTNVLILTVLLRYNYNYSYKPKIVYI